jgi:hypothetical protein
MSVAIYKNELSRGDLIVHVLDVDANEPLDKEEEWFNLHSLEVLGKLWDVDLDELLQND